MSNPVKIVYTDGHEETIDWDAVVAEQDRLRKFSEYMLSEITKGGVLWDIQEPKEDDPQDWCADCEAIMPLMFDGPNNTEPYCATCGGTDIQSEGDEA